MRMKIKNERTKKDNMVLKKCCNPVLHHLHERENLLSVEIVFLKFNVAFFSTTARISVKFLDEELENAMADGFILNDMLSKHFGKQMFGLGNIFYISAYCRT